MSDVASVTIDASQFPEAVRRDLLTSLRKRRVNHKFHYDSIKQTQRWLALHQIYSPSRNDADCAATYDRAFEFTASRIKDLRLHVIGLGCGGGQKDSRLLRLLKKRGLEVFYTPCDVSTAMVLIARQTALSVVPKKQCFPFVCDLASVKNLPGLFAEHSPKNVRRLVTFFGMIPNFEPQNILGKLRSLVRPNDWLLFSANLAPGENYAGGVETILPQYDNAPTSDWLMTFLLDLGVQPADGELRFSIKTGASKLRRIEANFYFNRPCIIHLENSRFDFIKGDSVRLFFSYRYTPARVAAALARHRLMVEEKWIATSEEEGVFLCSGK
jgi:L-histidine N-alpha-methyltransferase